MENIEFSGELRVSQAVFEQAQRNARAKQPRRTTNLLAVNPGADDITVAAKRIVHMRLE